MEDAPARIDLVKALAHPDRLKVVGALVRQPATLKQISTTLSLSTRQAYNHLSFLKYVGVVEEQAGCFQLSKTAPIHLRDFDPDEAALHPPVGLDPERYRVLKTYIRSDGSLRRIPNSRTQPQKFRMVLEYLQAAFETGQQYSEKQVNAILAAFHMDTAGLRRDLVDAGLLKRTRDGSRYWLPETQGEP